MNRAEAVKVLRELAHLHRELAVAPTMEISALPHSDECELKIECTIDSHVRSSINEFLKKKNLNMKEDNGFIIIRSQTTESLPYLLPVGLTC